MKVPGSLRRYRLLILVLLFAAMVGGWFFGRKIFRRTATDINDPEIIETVSRNQSKLLVIGIDGASWQIIERLSAEGKLPNLQKLMQSGSSGIMHSEPPMISPSLWTTFATGVSRRVHGIDNFTFKPVGSYATEPMDSRVRGTVALWEMLGHFRKRVAVINWNAAAPAEPVNGVFIADGAGPQNLGPDYVYPGEWSEKLKALPLLRVEWLEGNFSRWNHKLLPKAYDEDRFVAGAALSILKDEKPELMLIYLRNIDLVSHLFWKYAFPSGADYNFEVSAEDKERYGDIIEKYYIFTDELLGRLVAQSPGYQLMIFSDHGHAATYPPKNVFLEINKLLFELGYLKFRSDGSGQIDWAKSSLFNLEDFHKDLRGVYINLKGREPEGTIAFQDYDRFRGKAVKALRAVRGQSGEKLFKRVLANPAKKNPLVSGPVDPPDILVEFNPLVLADRYLQRDKGDPKKIFIGDIIWSYADVSGDHAPEGVIIISGEHAAAKTGISVSIYDVAPTILWLFDAPVGRDMPGHVLKRDFNYRDKPVRYIDSWTGKVEIPVRYKPKPVSVEERERLKALGYTK